MFLTSLGVNESDFESDFPYHERRVRTELIKSCQKPHISNQSCDQEINFQFTLLERKPTVTQSQLCDLTLVDFFCDRHISERHHLCTLQGLTIDCSCGQKAIYVNAPLLSVTNDPAKGQRQTPYFAVKTNNKPMYTCHRLKVMAETWNVRGVRHDL
jgi:hypothetical protein